ncbi:FAD binding domain-containing protein [Cucurbitaria berberidis CBS 394.84]|uniref:FAD binding domain-containing protein n=1 Tax=Cucurbitaria berberidis CBS 394.84 TaxID=1168544 RepID=A0A9P4GNK8_9PLEO|nr:FAD binding domain-containing protein [Cucurbitaria berberidis CBS 394.84]KAF1849778.1 FAD binding domain-containing protein [Cucurbitaria berberidis CBS 394.84]
MRVLSFITFVSAVSALVVRQTNVAQDLKSLVSSPSSVTVELRARWSTYYAPLPAVVVKVQTERDVALIVKYCTKFGVPFLAQNGGIGWAKTFSLSKFGVLIDLAGLNKVTVGADKKTATIGGGASIGDTIAAANAAGALVITGNCNCVGALGALLGGGYGNLMGEVGFGVDNIISLRVVLSTGEIVTASKSENPDLFWALRGAGPNFGVVISATVNALPATPEDRTAWINNLFFTPDKLTQLAQAVEDLPLKPEQRIYMVLTSSGPPLNQPSILITGFLRKGTEETGRKAFAPFYALGPVLQTSAITTYDHWNDANIGFCTRGDRKPAYSSTIKTMSAQKWPEIWELYKGFQAKGPNTAVLVERYNLTKAISAPVGSAAMNEALRRDAFAQAIVIPWYTDASLDAEAEKFGQSVRALWTRSKTPTNDPTYANFAHGDETSEAIYGSSLPKLKILKKYYDPSGTFNQWFRIKP